MKKITSPLTPQSKGSKVGNVQDALRLLLDQGFIRTFDAPNRPTAEELASLAQTLAEERTRAIYGKATKGLVKCIQSQEGLGNKLAGAVESKTARRLNQILKGLGAFDDTVPAPGDKLFLGAKGSNVASLHQKLSARGFRISPEEMRDKRFGPATRDAVKAFQVLHGQDATGDIDEVTEAAMAAETGAPSEFERHLGNVIARIGRLDISRLTTRRRARLARETGIDRAQIDMLAQAVTLRDRIDRLAGADPDRPAATVSAETEITYGLLRAGALANPDARSASDLAAAVKASIESGVVSPAAEEAARGVLDRFNRIAVLLPSEMSRASLGDALATLPRGERLTEEQSVQFATL